MFSGCSSLMQIHLFHEQIQDLNNLIETFEGCSKTVQIIDEKNPCFNKPVWFIKKIMVFNIN